MTTDGQRQPPDNRSSAKSSDNFSIGLIDFVAMGICAAVFWTNSKLALLTNLDLGWLTRTGQLILESGIPHKLPFAWTNPESNCVAYQWLFEVTVAKLFEWGSIWLIGLTANWLTAMLIFVVLPIIFLSKRVPLCISYILLTFAQTPHWFYARPQLISYFFLLGLVVILEAYRLKERHQLLFIIPFLFLLWSNIHTFWMIGFVVLLIYAACDAYRTRTASKSFLLAICFSLLALLINPYGFGLITYSWSFLNGSQYQHIAELLPSFSLDTAGILSFIVFAWIILLKQRQFVSIEGFLIFSFSSILALMMRRFEPVAVILSWNILGDAISHIEKIRFYFYQNTFDVRRSIPLLAVPTMIFSSIAWYWSCPTNEQAWMYYTQNTKTILGLVQEFKPSGTKLFHDPSIGSWSIGLNAKPVFVDTRFDAYPKNFVESVIKCLEGRDLSLLQQFGINQIISRDDVGLGYVMLLSPDWVLGLHDGTYGWWLRKDQTVNWLLSDALVLNQNIPKDILKATIETRSGKYLLLSRKCLGEKKIIEAREYALAGLALMPKSKALIEQLHNCSKSVPTKN